jgi:hypothetical protein
VLKRIAWNRRVVALGLALAFAGVIGCGGSSAPPPTPHQPGDGGVARPHGTEPASKGGGGRKSPPRLDD